MALVTLHLEVNPLESLACRSGKRIVKQDFVFHNFMITGKGSNIVICFHHVISALRKDCSDMSSNEYS